LLLNLSGEACLLFVWFWHLGLENIPEGTFTHRRVSAEVAKQMIAEARSSGSLRGVSQDDLLAPHEEHEAENHKALCRVLGEHHGIALSIKDFVFKDELEDGRGYTIHPLQFAEIDTTSPLMIVNCHDEMASRQTKGALKFEVSPDSITFHLFEAAATRRADSPAPLARRRREHKRKPRSQLSLTPRYRF
jgi:hypothetical protein